MGKSLYWSKYNNINVINFTQKTVLNRDRLSAYIT